MVAAALLAVVVAACGGPVAESPIAPRPYLVSLDTPQDVPDGEVSGELAVVDGCVVVETDAGTVFPLFAVRARFGPLDAGGRPTLDVVDRRIELGEEVTFAGALGEVGQGARATYPGVDFTRCTYDRFAILGEVS